MRQPCITVLIVSLIAVCAAGAARSDDGDVPRTAAPRPVIAVAEFTGDDAATSRFLSDALVTDLAQSREMRLVERSEIRRAQTELQLVPSDPYENQQMRTLGRMVHADRLIVGSYLIRDNQVMVNARLLDVSSGRLVEGAGANVNGDTRSLLTLVHRLAHLLHRKVTGADLSIDGEGAEPRSASDLLSSPHPVGSDASQPSRYHVGQQSATNDPGYRARPAASPTRQTTVRPVSVTVVSPPVTLPTFVPYYVPLTYGYPYFSFGWWPAGRLPFAHFHVAGHFGRRRGW